MNEIWEDKIFTTEATPKILPLLAEKIGQQWAGLAERENWGKGKAIVKYYLQWVPPETELFDKDAPEETQYRRIDIDV